MSLFVVSSCGIVGDTIINRMTWSNVDQLAAMSASIVDEQDRETNQIMFTNNEVGKAGLLFIDNCDTALF